MSTDLLEQVKDGVAVLTLNRPDRLNAMSRPMLDALLEALPRLAEDPAVGRGRAHRRRPRLLRGRRRQGHGGGQRARRHDHGGAGAGAALPHGDLALAPRDAQAHHRDDARGRRRAPGSRWRWPATCASPATRARFGTAFARVGYSGDFGGSYYLTQLVGTAKARELYFTADLLDAQQALAWASSTAWWPTRSLEEETMALASTSRPRAARGLSLHEAEHERGGERARSRRCSTSRRGTTRAPA